MAYKKADTPTGHLPCPSFSNGLPPGGYDATLTYDPTSQGLLQYSGPVQARASEPDVFLLTLCYPDLDTRVGGVFFDPLDAGKPCALLLDGVPYTKNATTGAPLTFQEDTVLLGR